MGNGDCKFHRAQRVSSPWMVSSFEPRWIEQDPAFRPGRGLVHRDFMIAEVWVPQQSNSRRGHWFQKEKAPPDDGAKDCHAWGYARVTQSKPHPFTFAGQHVQIGAGYNSLGHDSLCADRGRAQPPARLPSALTAGRGAHAIRALRACCRGIVSGLLVSR